VGPDLEDGAGQAQIGHVVRIERVGGQRQSRVHAVRSLVCPDGIPLRRVPDSADDGSPDAGVGMAPTDGDRINPEGIRVRCERDVIRLGYLRQRDAIGVLWTRFAKERKVDGIDK